MGESLNPEQFNITKFPQSKIVQQNPEDYLKTTGLFMKQTDRTTIKDLNTMRSTNNNFITPAKSLYDQGEYRNNQQILHNLRNILAIL